LQKLRYEVDPHNRLVAQVAGNQLALRRFRKVLDGKFKIGPANSLSYHIKAPMRGTRPNLKLPHQVKLKGRWSLSKNHDLHFTLDKWRRQSLTDVLTIQGEIVAAEAGALLFAVTTRVREDADQTNLLRLRGIWQADERNRLTFRVKKGQQKYDSLIFDGIWEIDRQHRIVYNYEKAQLKHKQKISRFLRFKGFWNISKRDRLSYELSRDGKSAFEFRVSAGRFDANRIRYRLGIGLADKGEPVRRRVSLFGQWRIKKNVGLLFEIEYEKGRLKAIIFGAEAKLTKTNHLEFKLKSRFGKKLDLKLKLSRKLLKGAGQAFLQLLKSRKDSGLYIGTAWRW